MTLDVDRLAQALADMDIWEAAHKAETTDTLAAAIAAEYDRLAEPPDDLDESKRAEWIARLDWHGHEIEVEVVD